MSITRFLRAIVCGVADKPDPWGWCYEYSTPVYNLAAIHLRKLFKQSSKTQLCHVECLLNLQAKAEKLVRNAAGAGANIILLQASHLQGIQIGSQILHKLAFKFDTVEQQGDPTA